MDLTVTISLIVSFVSIIGGIISIIIAVRNSRRTERHDAATEASELQAIQHDTSYTKNAIDELRLDIREQRRDTNQLSNEVVLLKERCNNTQSQMQHLQAQFEQHCKGERTE